MRIRLAVLFIVGGLLGVLGFGQAQAQTFNSGSTGADGAFNPSANTTLTLPPNGVFNFTTVNIPSNVTVKFTRNAANTPVTMLASGNVTIAGTIDVNGSPGVQGTSGTALGTTGGAGGPGGFDGGNGATGTVSTTGGAGRGPGGGTGGTGPTGGAGGGGNATGGTNGCAGSGSSWGVGGPAYGDATLLPLIGGSGGGGGGANLGSTGPGGGGGGGAIVIASSGTITLSSGGRILANAGGGLCGGASTISCSAGGGGGSIRLVATTVTGSGGTLGIVGGAFVQVSPSCGGWGGAGRLRVEGFTNTLSATILGPLPPSVTNGAPTTVALPNTPTLQITSVGGVATPANPAGAFFAPDVVLPGTTTNPVTVNLAASNVPVGTVLTVTVVGFMGASTSTTSTPLSGSLASSTATASVTIPTNEPAVIGVAATFTIAALDGQGPYYADGEPVERVKVTALGNGGNALAFITLSGREVPVAAR